MENVNIFILIVAIIGWVTAIAITYQCYQWRNKHDEAISSWTIETRRKDEIIEKLENEIKAYENMERVIKIEKVFLEPKEFTCKFSMHERFLDDKDLCKRVMVSEAARYLAEEFKKDPYLYTILTERSYAELRDFVKIRFRMLPYTEPASFEDIFWEEKV